MWFTENASPGALARISLPPTVEAAPWGQSATTPRCLPRRSGPNAQSTEFYFEYGPGEDTAKKSATASAGAAGTTSRSRIGSRTSSPRPKYHYRVVATNDSGTHAGSRRRVHDRRPRAEPEFAAGSWPSPTAASASSARVAAGAGSPAGAPSCPVGTALDTRRGSVKLTSAAGAARPRPAPSAAACSRCASRARAAAAWTSTCAAATSGAVLAQRRPRRGAARGAQLRAPRADGRGPSPLGPRQRRAASAPTAATATPPCAARAGSPRTAATARFTRVTRGAVVVRDLARRRNVVVRAGHSYLARKRSPAARTRR